MASAPGTCLLVAGKLVVDEVLVCDHPPVPGSSQRARERRVTGGGQVWHTSRAAARTGVPVAVTGWCGRDDDSSRLRAELVLAGILDRLALHDPPSRSTVLVHGDDRIIVSHGSRGYVDPQAVGPAALDGAGRLHIDGYALDPVAGDALVDLAVLARDRGIPISIEPPSPAKLAESAAWVAALPPLDAVLGRPDEIASTLEILAVSPRVLVSHDQQRPIVTRSASDEITIPVPATGIAPLGAGDRFAGGWLAARLRGASLEGAVEAGIAAAFRAETTPPH